MKSREISERFRQALRSLGYVSPAQFLRNTSIPRSTVYSIWSDGRRPSAATLDLLEKEGINTEYLLDGIGAPLAAKMQVRDRQIHYGRSPENLMDEIRELSEKPGSDWELFSLVMQTIELMEPGQQRLIYLGLRDRFDEKPEERQKKKGE